MSKKFQIHCCTWLAILMSLPALAGERPTLQHGTRDPRPDILPYHLYYAHREYRREYNRPRYISGLMAFAISPTSQEAMVWYENKQAGNYDRAHTPPVYKRYFAPKPWEVLQTGRRPDFMKVDPTFAKDSTRESPAVHNEPRPAQTANTVVESQPIRLPR